MKNIKKNKKRKICFVITSFIHYSRNLLVLEELKKRKDVDLHIVIGGTALLSKYTSKYTQIKTLLEEANFKNLYEVHFNLEGDTETVKAKTVGLGIVEFTNIFNNIKPDAVLVRGDRFEVLSAATAASYMNIPIAHIEGGDVSGTLDEAVRHSITKLAHIHFPTNEESKKRILKMGENKKYIFNFGSPDIEMIDKMSKSKRVFDISKTGSGTDINLKDTFIIVMYHPVTTDVKALSKNTRNLLNAVYEMGVQTLWFWPNVDLGSEEISHEMRMFSDKVSGHKIRFMRYLQPEQFSHVLKNANCMVGNSSAGIKECSYLGIPVVNIGSRQGKRLRVKNVVDVSENKEKIKKAIEKQLSNGTYKSSNIYYKKNTSKNIAKTLATVNLYVQKSFAD
ncbi:MAG: UDP-N-acetylglucosamine 2-epimerase [Candidatus Pacebacteria bacterium]|jgi:UDP-hydrolysing UDP-N-acetyl-D-glucosamine 2-epimerase|nr:UDP-N-acetylglucosamine 2-epimerase [Candidatus Paceibacterota bacterium]